MSIKNPPFDGSAPCPMCPIEIRNLRAVAHNLINRYKHGEMSKVHIYMSELKTAVEATQGLVDSHFADSMHSQGRINQKPEETNENG